MPRIVEYEGGKHEFPDDFSDDDVSKALKSLSKAPEPAEPASSQTPPSQEGFFTPLKNSLSKAALTGAAALTAPMRDTARMAEEDTEGKDTLLSLEGAASVRDAASIGFGSAVEGAKLLADRPENPAQSYLTREQYQEIRALTDSGLSYREAQQQVRGRVQAEYEQKLLEHDGRINALNRATETALADNTSANPTEALRHGQNIATSAGLTAPGIIVGATTRNVPLALGVSAAPQFPLAYQESRDKGSSHERAMTSASLQTAAEVGGELLPMKHLLAGLGKTGVAKLIMDYAVRETGTEILTEATQALISKVVDSPEESWADFGEETLKTLVDVAIETPFSAALGGGLAHGISGRRDRKIEEVRKQAEAELQEILKLPEMKDKVERVEAAQEMLNESLAQEAESLNQELETELTAPLKLPELELTPEREAALERIDPLADEELDAILSSVLPPPITPEVANDGTSGIALEETLQKAEGQIGNTRKVRDNAANYEDSVNDLTPQAERKVLLGNAEIVGQAIGAVKVPRGVTTIGEPTEAFSQELLEATHELYAELAAQFAPDARIILSPQSVENRQAVGMTQRLASGEYVIIPAQGRKLKTVGGLAENKFNPQTKAKILSNITHEFGHVLAMERFFENVSPEVQLAFMQQQSSGKISEEVLAGLSQEQAALARDFMEFRQKVETENAAWFQHEWMGPALAIQRQLLSREVQLTPESSARSFVRRLVSRGHPEVTRLDAQMKNPITKEQRKALSDKKDKLIDGLVEDYLSFDEFMAEQMARYVHDKDSFKAPKARALLGGGMQYVREEENVRKDLMKTTLDKVQESLQSLFKALKKGIKLASGETYRIKAGTSFEQWVKSLSRTGQLMEATQTPVEVVGKKQVKKSNKAKLTEIAQTLEARTMRQAITFGRFSPKEKQELYRLVRENALHTANERMIEMLQSRVVKQLDVDAQDGAAFAGLTEAQALNEKVRGVALRAWGKHKERSIFFKSFFGDWEAGEGSKVVAADGKPMVVYHATQQEFEKFTRGDIGFHFGNLNAAHTRMYKLHPQNARNEEALALDVQKRIESAEYRGKREAALPKDEGILTQKELDWSIIPAYLNIRNPLVIEEKGDTAIWDVPMNMAKRLETMGILSKEEVKEVSRQQLEFQAQFTIDDATIMSEGGTKIRRQLFQPLRQMLRDKGYDGIKYENYVEGGTSWVAFDSKDVKTANGTFSQSSKIHLQQDVALDDPVGLELNTLANTLKGYESMGLTSRALRVLAKAQWYLLEQQHLAWIHPDFYHLDMANEASTMYTGTKSSLQALGEGVAQKWAKLGKETDAKLARALEKEAEEGTHWTELQNVEGKLRHVVTAETLKRLKENGLDVDSIWGKEGIEVYLESKQAMLQLLLAAQTTLARRLGQTVEDEKEFAIRLNELRKAFHQLRITPFLPRGDYGAWGVVVTEKGVNAEGEPETKTIYSRTFESESEVARARELITKSLKPNQTVRTTTRLSDEHRTLLALPAEYVDNAAEILGLTEAQKELMHELLHPVKSERLLQPYTKALEKIDGGSTDRMRNFADFIWHNSTMIARTEAMPALARAKRAGIDMYNQVNEMPALSERARQDLLHDIKKSILFMEKTTGYMLSPPNEWYGARSAVALVYLWGSLKTAALNLFGIITTGSAVTSTYGDIAGGAALAKAHKNLTELLATGTSGNVLVDTLYNRALAEGTLVQSYAAHLAGAATAGAVKRVVNRSRWTARFGQAAGMIADAGMLPFTLAEQYTRRITFLSVVNAEVQEAQKANKNIEAEAENIFKKAVRHTDLLQNSYTLANRPVIMRGTGPIGAAGPLATIFLSFMTHFTFNSAGGYTLGMERRAKLNMETAPKSVISNTQRMLFLLLLFGGYEALPGAENILDILDAIFLNRTGKTARQALREGIKSIPEVQGASWLNDPRWWGKGLGGDFFGFDISGSLGIGRLIPGTDSFAGTPQTAGEVIGRAAPALFGVTGSLAEWATQLTVDLINGNPIGKNMQRLPGAGGAVLTAYDWSKHGVTGSKGELIHEPNTKEIIGKGMNFNPTAVSEKREENWAKRQAVDYWTTQRSLLQRQYNFARDRNDREGEADVRKKIENFNDKVIDARMRLRPFDLNSNYRQHRKEVRKLELGIDPRNVRNLTADVEASFESE